MRALRFVARYRLTVALGLGVLAMATSIGVLARSSAANARATKALCALRENLEHRGNQGTAFLIEHPKGAPGIPRPVIVKSIRDTRSTLRALRILRC